MINLKLTTGDNHSKNYEFHQAAVTLGRESDNDIVLDDLRVSRHHALLQYEQDVLRLTDLNSGNGTFLNGQRIEMHTAIRLQEGDRVKLGACEITILDVTTARLTMADQGLQPLLQKLPSEIYLTSVSFADTPAASTNEALQAELEKKGKVLKLFYELSQKLSSLLEPAEIYDHVLSAVLTVTPAVRVVILQKDEEGDYLPVAVRWREHFNVANSGELPISQTVLARVAAQRAGILLADLESQAPNYTAQSLIMAQMRSVIASPVLAQNELLGMIYADLRESVLRFSADDLELLNAIALQAAIALNTAQAHERLQRQAAARARFERFLPHAVVDAVIRGSGSLKLGGVRQEITVFFADLRGFTSLSEERDPEEVVEILNRYFTLASELIFKHDGTLDKYIGDGLFAFFGAPYADPQHPQKAVRAAWELQHAMTAFNEGLLRDRLPPIAVGVGINTGQALIGYIGSEKRHDYTAIGDAVNIAARLEKLAHPRQILVSETTSQLLGDEFLLRQLGATAIKGKAQPLHLAEIIGVRPTQPTVKNTVIDLTQTRPNA